MRRYGTFARVSCDAVQESQQLSSEARIVDSAAALSNLLCRGLNEWEVARMLQDVEAGEVIQMAITASVARKLGFAEMLQ